MEKEFVPYTLALALKELGFDEVCFGIYTENEHLILVGSTSRVLPKTPHIIAPIYQQASRWFREKYNLFSSETYVRGINNGKLPVIHSYSFRIFNIDNFEDFYGDDYSTYEEAELECLIKLIEIVKEKK